MDIPREPRTKRKPLIYGGIAAAAVLVLTIAVAGLDPAAPAVERSLVVLDSVVRGTMVRQVRAPGNLVPERIRFVPAVTAGRVERKLVAPGAIVDARTVLLELSNPEVQLELLEAQRELSAAEQQLVSLRTSLENQRLNQASALATVRAQYLEAKRNADAARELIKIEAMSRAEAATAIERAEELETRLQIERDRLTLMTESVGPQLEVQEGQVARLRNIVAFQRNRLASMRVTAGMAGVLQDMALEEGQWVLPGQTLARVVNPERLKAVLRVPQVQARDVALGQRVLVDTRTDTIPGHVLRIDPAVEAGAVAVDVALDAELPQGARPDLAVDGTIEIERLPDVLHVGRPAYGQAESTVGLFKLVDGGGYAERVQVKLGRGSVNTIQVVDGLNQGDVVILSDMSRWDQYDRVRIR
ncbi:MAG: HlyD family efflux transporter periplasmic adaptor subunit [Gemmatimonadales bacterium]|nr:HlyD family efflux transporter periplasmic adaptor subunit [Gemmatimonadales bacterium]